MNSKSIVDELKELVKKGNVSRIVVRRGENEILNMSVNVGIVGGVMALSASAWIVIAAAIATVGFGCTVEIVKTNGEVESVYEGVSRKAAESVDAVKASVNKMKDQVETRRAEREAAQEAQWQQEGVIYAESAAEEATEEAAVPECEACEAETPEACEACPVSEEAAEAEAAPVEEVAEEEPAPACETCEAEAPEACEACPEKVEAEEVPAADETEPEQNPVD